ncbi:hypothetical protein Pelo_8071 [Pelomyxa schiedti]|nr:hypothetical protein Pelo_8071 [Pelomyxa schiedti]
MISATAGEQQNNPIMAATPPPVISPSPSPPPPPSGSPAHCDPDTSRKHLNDYAMFLGAGSDGSGDVAVDVVVDGAGPMSSIMGPAASPSPCAITTTSCSTSSSSSSASSMLCSTKTTTSISTTTSTSTCISPSLCTSSNSSGLCGTHQAKVNCGASLLLPTAYVKKRSSDGDDSPGVFVNDLVLEKAGIPEPLSPVEGTCDTRHLRYYIPQSGPAKQIRQRCFEESYTQYLYLSRQYYMHPPTAAYVPQITSAPSEQIVVLPPSNIITQPKNTQSEVPCATQNCGSDIQPNVSQTASPEDGSIQPAKSTYVVCRSPSKAAPYRASPLIESLSSSEVVDWIKAWMVKFKSARPSDTTVLLSEHFSDIVRVKNHRLCKTLNKTVKEVRRKVQSLQTVGTQRGAKSIIDIVETWAESLLPEIITFYFDFRSCRIAVFEGLCEFLFTQIFDIVWPKYVALNAKADQDISDKIRQFDSLVPEHLGVSKKFCLSSSPKEDPTTPLSVPYSNAIFTAQKLRKMKTSHTKVRCLQQIASDINASITAAYPTEHIELGADDFLPLFTYVLLKALWSPEPVCPHADVSFLQHFTCDSGMEGYFVVTYYTCISYISVLKEEDLPTEPQEPQLYQEQF